MTPPVPPGAASRPPRTRGQLLRTPILWGVAGASAVTALRFRDPHESGSWGYCPFLLITGQPCPGCGGLRAVNNLTHGDVLGAISSNAFAVAFVAVMGTAWFVWAVRRWRGEDVPWIRLSPLWTVLILVSVAIFSVLRWSPWGVWLRP
ncbi:MAG: DUF2752 domain-containing protein [Aeromicrobium sp.]